MKKLINIEKKKYLLISINFQKGEKKEVSKKYLKN